jgi:hypothetical protein
VPSLRKCVLLTGLALLGCASTEPSETERDRFLAAMALWQSHELQSYHYEFRFVCGECLPEWTHLRRIRVDDGVVTQVADLVTSDLTTIDDRSVTIFKLFEDIQLTLDANPWRFAAEYHPTLGYPISVSVDLREAVQDDEFGYVAQNLVALPQ